MDFCRVSFKVFTLFLVVVLLTIRIGIYAHESFVGPIQDNIYHNQIILSDNATEKPSSLFKLKRVVFDFSFFDRVEIVTVYREIPPLPYVQSNPNEPPKVYLDIIVPPDGNPAALST